MFENVSNIDWARAAAFLDGEGSILISRRGKKGSHRGHFLRVTLTNTDPRLVIWFKNLFGGTVITTGKPQKANHRLAYRWMVSCKTASEFIKGCLPYLILKRDQAEIALAFQSTLKGQGNTVTIETFQQRDWYLEEMQKLKWEDHKQWPRELSNSSGPLILREI